MPSRWPRWSSGSARSSAIDPAGARRESSQTIEQLRERYGERYKWLVLLTVMIGTMASIMASTIVNVAIPDISRFFTLDQAQAQWVSAGFMLAVTLSMLLTPWLLQRFGLRRTYTWVVIMLSVGALIGGLAQAYWLVLSMRVVEGLAAGVLQPIPSIIILRAFAPAQQGKAMGVFGFGVVLAPAIGPSIGGFLVEHFGWRSIFFVMIPFGIAALALARRYLPWAAISNEKRPLDWMGLTLISVATISLLNGVTRLSPADRPVGLCLLVLSAGALAGFVWLQRRSSAPLMNLKPFAYRQFAVGSLVALIYGMGLFGSTYLLPIYLQLALEYGPARAGLVLLPAGLVLAVVIPLAGRLADRFPTHWLVSGGLLVLAASFGLMATVSPSTAYLVLVMWVVMGRIGLGFVLPALGLGAMRGLAMELIAQGSSTINFARQLGGALGVSLTGILLDWRLHAHGVGLSSANGGPVNERVKAFDETFLAVAALCACAAFAATQMTPRKRAAPAGTAGS